MSHEKTVIDFDDVGMVISVRDKRLHLSKTQFKIMSAIHANYKDGKETTTDEIIKLLRPGASENSAYQHLYSLRKLFNDMKSFPLRLNYVRRNGDHSYEMKVKA